MNNLLSSLWPFRSWYRWNPAAYHHWKTWTVSYEVFEDWLKMYTEDNAVTQDPCGEQGYSYRLNLRWLSWTKLQQKQRTATHHNTVNTPAHSLELFDLCPCDSLLCITEKQAHDKYQKHRWRCSSLNAYGLSRFRQLIWMLKDLIRKAVHAHILFSVVFVNSMQSYIAYC